MKQQCNVICMVLLCIMMTSLPRVGFAQYQNPGYFSNPGKDVFVNNILNDIIIANVSHGILGKQLVVSKRGTTCTPSGVAFSQAGTVEVWMEYCGGIIAQQDYPAGAISITIPLLATTTGNIYVHIKGQPMIAGPLNTSLLASTNACAHPRTPYRAAISQISSTQGSFVLQPATTTGAQGSAFTQAGTAYVKKQDLNSSCVSLTNVVGQTSFVVGQASCTVNVPIASLNDEVYDLIVVDNTGSSIVGTFNIYPRLNPPVLISPTVNQVLQDNILLDWNSDIRATSQRVQVARKGTAFDPETGFAESGKVFEFPPVGSTQPLTETQMSWDCFVPNAEYVWTARSGSVPGANPAYYHSLYATPVPFSATRNYEVNPIVNEPLPFSGLYPAPGQVFPLTTTSIPFSWTMTGATTGNLQLQVKQYASPGGHTSNATFFVKNNISGNSQVVSNANSSGNKTYAKGIYEARLKRGSSSTTWYFAIGDVTWTSELSQASIIGSMIEETARHYNVPSSLLKAIMKVESNLDVTTTVHADGVSYGLMGVCPTMSTNNPVDLAAALKHGSTAYPGWPEYAGMNAGQILSLIQNDGTNPDPSLAWKTNIRAAGFLLRYYWNMRKDLRSGAYIDGQIVDDIDNFPITALESWWFIIARYGVKSATTNESITIPALEQNNILISNYPYRIYNTLMDGVPSLSCPAIPITLPPHFQFRVARLLGREAEVKSGDNALIPHVAGLDEQLLRLTVPFLPARDLGILHSNTGSLLSLSACSGVHQLFSLQFVYPGFSATSAMTPSLMTSRFDYSKPGVGERHATIQEKDRTKNPVYYDYSRSESLVYVPDGLLVLSNGSFGSYDQTGVGCSALLPGYRIQGVCLYYDSHDGYDYSGTIGNGDPDATLRLLYPTAPGKLYLKQESTGSYDLVHTNGYKTRYVHARCRNTAIPDGVMVTDMNQFVLQSGNKAMGRSGEVSGAHGHIQPMRYLSNNPADWQSKDAPTIAIDPYGWSGDDDTKGARWTQASYARLWSPDVRNGSLPRTGTCGQSSARASLTLSAYPNPSTDDMTLELEGDDALASVMVSTTMGATVSTISVDTPDQKRVTLSTRSYRPGLYVVVANTTNGSRIVTKFVKQQ